MTLRSALLAATVLALPIAANAQPINGVYVGAGVGINYLPQENIIAGATSGNLKSNTVGPAIVLSLGYGFGNGLRAEVEGGYRANRFNGTSGLGGAPAGGFEQKYGVMANALYDFNISPMVVPYLGAGVGYQAVEEQNVNVAGISAKNGTKGSFAYQAIAGVGFPIASAPGLALTAEYRFMGLAGDRSYSANPNPFVTSGKSTDNYNHSLLVGVRYAFGAPAMMAATAATSAQAPAAAMARSYLVFFDWDKATLTERARGIIKDAATNSTKVSYTKIDLNGNADTSGTPAYNKGLSMRRAEAVAAELVKDGVPKNAIAITASGDTKLLVPTGPGVREPQNRRVEINIR